MGYYNIYSRYKNSKWNELFEGISAQTIENAVYSDEVGIDQFIALLSVDAEERLEEMASRGHELTLKYFGKSIQLYTPLYLSNYCDNGCVYCGFNSTNKIERRKLSLDEVEKEARAISSSGLKHILILTGESRSESPIGYIKDCVKLLREFFSSISIEVYALNESEYAELVREGVDGLTIYQEVYDEAIYNKVHPFGPKVDYKFRLDAPERGARAGMRNVNIGVLFGLDDWRREVFLMGLHAKYLQDKFPDVEIGASIPRIRPHTGSFTPAFEVSDKNIVQTLVALRIFLPRISLAVSTREDPLFRENIAPLGITRMSAGSITCVGGHAIEAHEETGASQFDISDRRSVGQIKAMLESKGYQPVLKDWLRL